MNAPRQAARPLASLEISLHIGQRVRHSDFHGKRVTGVVRGLSVDTEDVLRADIALDDAIAIPPINDDDHELRIYRQHVPAHELAPFDEREELIATLLEALQAEQEWRVREAAGALDPEWHYERMVAEKRRAAIAKATGSAA